MKLIFLFACITAQLIAANCKEPSNLPEPCHKGDPNYKSCLLKYLNKLIPFMFTGIPEYRIPPLDPLDVPIIEINRILQVITVTGLFKDLRVVGLSQVEINDLKVDPEKLVIELAMTHPHVYISTEYSGEISDRSVRSHAFLEGNFTDIKHNLKITLKPFKKAGVKHFSVDKFNFKSRMGDAHIKLTAANPQEEPFVTFIEDTFNQNTREVLDLLNPVYVQYAADVFRAILEQSLAQTPAEKFIPE